jgi:hypothetical protein
MHPVLFCDTRRGMLVPPRKLHLAHALAAALLLSLSAAACTDSPPVSDAGPADTGLADTGMTESPDGGPPHKPDTGPPDAGCQDSDGDTVCDERDRCAGDDTQDADEDGTPDACDCDASGERCDARASRAAGRSFRAHAAAPSPVGSGSGRWSTAPRRRLGLSRERPAL